MYVYVYARMHASMTTCVCKHTFVVDWGVAVKKNIRDVWKTRSQAYDGVAIVVTASVSVEQSVSRSHIDSVCTPIHHRSS